MRIGKKIVAMTVENTTRDSSSVFQSLDYFISVVNDIDEPNSNSFLS